MPEEDMPYSGSLSGLIIPGLLREFDSKKRMHRSEDPSHLGNFLIASQHTDTESGSLEFSTEQELMIGVFKV